MVAAGPVFAATTPATESHEADVADHSLDAPPLPDAAPLTELAPLTDAAPVPDLEAAVESAETQQMLLRVEVVVSPIEYCVTWDPADLGLVPVADAVGRFGVDDAVIAAAEPGSEWPIVWVVPLGPPAAAESAPVVAVAQRPLNGRSGVIDCAELAPVDAWTDVSTPASTSELAAVNVMRIRWAPESWSGGYAILSGFAVTSSSEIVGAMIDEGTALEALLVEPEPEPEPELPEPELPEPELPDVLVDLGEFGTLRFRIVPPVEQVPVDGDEALNPISLVIGPRVASEPAPDRQAIDAPSDPPGQSDATEPEEPLTSDDAAGGEEILDPADDAIDVAVVESVVSEPAVVESVVSEPAVVESVVSEPEFTQLPDPVAVPRLPAAIDGDVGPEPEPEPEPTDPAAALPPAPPQMAPMPLAAFTVLGVTQSPDGSNPFVSEATKPLPEGALDVGGSELIAEQQPSPVDEPDEAAADQAPAAIGAAPESEAGLAVESAPAQLPHTGGGTQNLALSGLGMVLLGIMLSRSGRRGQPRATLATP